MVGSNGLRAEWCVCRCRVATLADVRERCSDPAGAAVVVAYDGREGDRRRPQTNRRLLVWPDRGDRGHKACIGPEKQHGGGWRGVMFRDDQVGRRKNAPDAGSGRNDLCLPRSRAVQGRCEVEDDDLPTRQIGEDSPEATVWRDVDARDAAPGRVHQANPRRGGSHRSGDGRPRSMCSDDEAIRAVPGLRGSVRRPPSLASFEINRALDGGWGRRRRAFVVRAGGERERQRGDESAKGDHRGIVRVADEAFIDDFGY